MTHGPLLADLTEAQRLAVTSVDGPLLVTAGPGTGKTLTIVRRLAWLVSQGVRPESILAVTFTNRAAQEMRERAEGLLGEAARRVFIGTFHLLGLRIIRECMAGSITLYDRREQAEVLRRRLGLSAKGAEHVAEQISRARNSLEPVDGEMAVILAKYRTAMAESGAVDLDDLILKPVELLHDPAVSLRYRERFPHIIVDEYQDVNPAQERLLRLLAGERAILCAVGDADQAIYAFRGSDVGSMLRFGSTFPGTQHIALSRSYRSAPAILRAAEAVIRNNRLRIERTVDPVRTIPGTLWVISVPDEREEAEVIVREIEARMGGTSRQRMSRGGPADDRADGSWCFGNFGVVFRTNAQVKALEEALSRSGIPYQVIGKGNAAQRKAADETIAFLRSLAGDAPTGTVADCSAELKLLSPADLYDPRADAVTLMTLHTAKGLEFRTVFITGVEEGLVPYTLMKENVDIEEERRLLYVGMTRAQDELFLLHARSRFLYGRRLEPAPSPFLREIPGDLVKTRTLPDRPKNRRGDEEQLGLF